MIEGFGRKSGGANAAIKVDLAKVYDTCSWEALEGTLEDFGFSEGVIRMIMMCVTSTSLSFLIDRAPTPQIWPGRGLRQGDPLSPYLFTLLMQNFSHIMKTKVKNGEISVFKKHGTKGVSHLGYTDDLLDFCKAKWTPLGV